MKRIVPILLVLSALGAQNSFRWNEASDFRKGRLQNVMVKENGALALSPYARKVVDIDTSVLWCALETAGGVWVGGGHDGDLFFFAKGGTNFRKWTLPAQEVVSLVEAPDGSIWAGTAPKGLLCRVVEGTTNVEIVASFTNAYLWDVSFEGKSLLVAAGNPGAVFRVDPSTKKVEAIFATEENNVLRARSFGGVRWFATGGRGLVWRQEEGKAARLVYEAGGRDVNALLPDGNGVLVSSSGKRMVSETVGGETRSYFQNEVLSLSPAGEVRSLWSIRNQTIPALARGRDGLVIAATGEDGDVVQIDPRTGRSALVYKLLAGGVASFSGGAQGSFFVGGQVPALFRLEAEVAATGSWTSDVVDAKSAVTWGRVDRRPEANDVAVRVSLRGGNQQSPLTNWSEWVPQNGDKAIGLSARFAQVKLEWLPKAGEGAEIADVRLYYAKEVRSPSLKTVRIGRNAEIEKAAKLNLGSDDLLLSWELADEPGDSAWYEIAWKDARDERWTEIPGRIRQRWQVFKRSAFPDGDYRFRVTAGDRASPGDAKDQLASRVVSIDNTPPLLRDVTLAAGKIRFAAVDSFSAIRRLSVSAQLEEWRPLVPQDGVFDSVTESFEWALPVGATFVMVKVEDEMGNEGLVSVPVPAALRKN